MIKPEKLRQLFEQGHISEEEYLDSGGTIEEHGSNSIHLEKESTAQMVIGGENNHVTAIINQVQGVHLSDAEMRAEIGRYLNWVVSENRTITLHGIQHPDPDRKYVTLNLDTVYVPLRAQATAVRGYGRAETEPRNITLDEVLNIGRRLAITGGPGCGKTTVLMHIAWALAAALVQNNPALAQEKLRLTPPLPLPIFIPINRYADHLRQFKPIERRQRTLATFISQYMIERQATLNLPEDFFAQLLVKGEHVILLLDGLDEVPTEEERAIVTQAVEDLVQGHEALRVVVTCRTVAYKGIEQFREVRVQSLSEAHIATLIGNAYRWVYADSAERQVQQMDDLLAGIRKLEQERRERLGEDAEPLVNSPLLVRMMLIVHISERKLPDQRAELYLRAVENLLAPTYGRDVHVGQAIGNMVGGKRALALVQYVAYQMHQRGESQGREVTARELRAWLTKHPSFADLAEPFMAMTYERGTVMEAKGEQYRFIHLGFQEVLAARYMDDVLLREQTFHELLAEKLTDSWWREPLLLLAGYLGLTSPERAEQLLRYWAELDGTLAQADMNVQWAAAELAAIAVLEWPEIAPALRQQVVKRVRGLVEEAGQRAGQNKFQQTWGKLSHGYFYKSLQPHIRDRMNLAFAILGDDRPGVCTQEPELHPVVGTEIAISRYQVTNAQFRYFMRDGGYTAKWDKAWSEEGRKLREEKLWQQPRFWDDGRFNQPNQPVVGVSWYEAEAYANWLSEVTGQPYRLPTEQEWEQAARNPKGGDYPWGEWAEGHANTREAGIGRTSAVGLFPKGVAHCGAHDMAGNVWEWTSSWYDKDKDSFVLRGGSWSVNQNDVRASDRDWDNPGERRYYVGFRLVSPIFLSPER